LKSKAFTNLTRDKKVFITDALKFGGHFLIYQGDPELFHSKYIAVVTENGVLDPTLFSAFQRAANSAKKGLMIISIN
jgi:tRNA splicing endonuclease